MAVTVIVRSRGVRDGGELQCPVRRRCTVIVGFGIRAGLSDVATKLTTCAGLVGRTGGDAGQVDCLFRGVLVHGTSPMASSVGASLTGVTASEILSTNRPAVSVARTVRALDPLAFGASVT